MKIFHKLKTKTANNGSMDSNKKPLYERVHTHDSITTDQNGEDDIDSDLEEESKYQIKHRKTVEFVPNTKVKQ